MEEFDTDVVKELKGFIPIEQLVSKQLDRIMHYRTIRKWDFWEEGIEGLIDLLTPEDEQKAVDYMETNQVSHDITNEGRERYNGLLRFIKKMFTDHKILWKKRGYERGHD
jgi:hypothetical protein